MKSTPVHFIKFSSSSFFPAVSTLFWCACVGFAMNSRLLTFREDVFKGLATRAHRRHVPMVFSPWLWCDWNSVHVRWIFVGGGCIWLRMFSEKANLNSLEEFFFIIYKSLLKKISILKKIAISKWLICCTNLHSSEFHQSMAPTLLQLVLQHANRKYSHVIPSALKPNQLTKFLIKINSTWLVLQLPK